MARHAHTFRLDDTDPRERALQRRLEDLAHTREKASTIVEALLSHHAGAAGVTLITLNDKLDRLLAFYTTASAPPVGEDQAAASAPDVRAFPADGITYLDTLGT